MSTNSHNNHGLSRSLGFEFVSLSAALLGRMYPEVRFQQDLVQEVRGVDIVGTEGAKPGILP
jgi:hypothetical protein